MAKRTAWVGPQRGRFNEGGEALGRLAAARVSPQQARDAGRAGISLHVGEAMVSERQARAGRAYADTYGAWAMLAAAPARYPVCAEPRGLQPLPSPAEEEKMRRDFAALSDRLREIGERFARLPASRLVAAVVEMVCLENVLPVAWERPENVHAPTLVALRLGLDALVEQYNIPAEEVRRLTTQAV